jgi:hypothetical protein
MQSVCLECHNENFIEDFYADGDVLVESINGWVNAGTEMIQPLLDQGLMTPLTGDAAFDDPIDFTYFELWHHWGRTAKFGAWMQGPDYTQWHGAYEMVSDLEELEEMVNERLEAGEIPAGDAHRVLTQGTPETSATAEPEAVATEAAGE